MTDQRILIGVDGSPGSRKAVEFVADRAGDLGADVHVVLVMDPSAEFIRDLPPIGFGTWRQSVRARLKTDWVQPLRTAGVDLSIDVVEGAPAETLMAKADELDCDLIVIGTHGHGGIADRITGSVSYALTHRAHQPVIVVPPDAPPCRPMTGRSPEGSAEAPEASKLAG